MLCAHTIRRLKPGTAERFIEEFQPSEEDPPAGWVSFHALRNLGDENEVGTFGFVDGTLDELERSQREAGFEELRGAVEQYVDAVIANGVYEVVVSRDV
jgi:hypothetical protein